MAESASSSVQASTHRRRPSYGVEDLAIQTCDTADSFNEVLRAYTALEKLVDTAALNDSEVLTPSRTELSALLRLLNTALLDRIQSVSASAAALREALQAKPCAV